MLGFLLISALATAGVFNKPQLLALGNLSRWAFLLTFAGCWFAHEFQGPVEAGSAALCGGRDW